MSLKKQWEHNSKKTKLVIVAYLFLLLFSFFYLWEPWGDDMKKVYIVQLSNSNEPIYPKVCAVCGVLKSEPLVALSLDGEDARTDYMFYQLLKKNTLQNQPFLGILAHHKCIRKVQYTLLKHFFLIILVGAAVAAIGVMSGFGIFFSLIAAVILATPLFYFVFTTPLPVEYFFHEKENLFSFTNQQYAEKFAHLNDAGLQEGDYTANFPRSYKSLNLFERK